jgi:hypothetical protein
VGRIVVFPNNLLPVNANDRKSFAYSLPASRSPLSIF